MSPKKSLNLTDRKVSQVIMLPNVVFYCSKGGWFTLGRFIKDCRSIFKITNTVQTHKQRLRLLLCHYSCKKSVKKTPLNFQGSISNFPKIRLKCVRLVN